MIERTMGAMKLVLMPSLGVLLGLGLAAEAPTQDDSGAGALPSHLLRFS